MAHRLFWAYTVLGFLTLIFQIWVRTGQCDSDCTVSYAKAVIWAVIWPLSWVAYLKGVF